MNAVQKKQQARRMRRLAAEPVGPWEYRKIPPDLYRQAFGDATAPELCGITHAFVNNRYSVQVSELETPWGTVEHLWIRRHDEQPIRSWPELQRIKNELAGPARVAVEVFPAQSEVVDVANMLHLWVLPEGFELPFSLKRCE